MTRIGFVVSAAVCVMVFGCDRAGPPPEMRINEAYPVSRALQSAQDSLLALMTPEAREEFDALLQAKYQTRAIACARGYEPSTFTSIEEIRQNVKGSECFHKYDEHLTAWLGTQLIRYRLMQPALRPVATLPSSIIADNDIGSVDFAARAGVALVHTRLGISIIDLASGAAIYRPLAGVEQRVASLSPNGRLFVSGDVKGGSSIRDAETGEELAHYPEMPENEFHWLEHAEAVLLRDRSGNIRLLDLRTAETAAVRLVTGGIATVVQVPGNAGEFLLFSYRTAAKLHIERIEGELATKLLAEVPLPRPFASNKGCLTADGSRYVNFGQVLSILSLNTFAWTQQALEPLHVFEAVPSSAVDGVIVRAALTADVREGFKDYLLSIDDGSVTQLDRARLPQGWIEYVPAYRSNVLIAGPKMEALTTLPLLERKKLEDLDNR